MLNTNFAFALCGSRLLEIFISDVLPASANPEPLYFCNDAGGLPLVAARGHVSADGARIETDPGQGIERLTWLAIRASQ